QPRSARRGDRAQAERAAREVHRRTRLLERVLGGAAEPGPELFRGVPELLRGAVAHGCAGAEDQGADLRRDRRLHHPPVRAGSAPAHPQRALLRRDQGRNHGGAGTDQRARDPHLHDGRAGADGGTRGAREVGMTAGMLHPDGPAGMTGQVAVVTGAARGIGAEVAKELAAAGAAVTVLDALVPCAAIYGDAVSLEELAEPDLDSVLDVNVKGTMWSVGGALPHMRDQGGRIVCIGSVAGKIGGVLAGPHYVASKGAVHALVRWIAKTEAANGIVANGVAPGVVDTPMITGKGYRPDGHPLGRFAAPEEIAR